MSQHRPTEALVNCLLASRYIIKEFVGGGSNGSFHYGLDTKTKQLVGIKFESKHMPNPQLFLEFQFYRILQGVRFIPNLLLICPATSEWDALILELQGPTLYQMRDKCGGTFSLLTTTKIMIQLLNIFEYVHDHGILYRDVKPENFLIGLPNTSKWCTVFLIDLGYCKKYLVKGNRHMERQVDKYLTGTGRYASVNNHRSIEVSRRDDLEAILYMIIFLHKGELPWHGAPGMTMEERMNVYGQVKKSISAAELCANMPLEYERYLTTVKALQFTQRPPYRKLMAQFRHVLTRLGTSMGDQVYDWDMSHRPKQGRM